MTNRVPRAWLRFYNRRRAYRKSCPPTGAKAVRLRGLSGLTWPSWPEIANRPFVVSEAAVQKTRLISRPHPVRYMPSNAGRFSLPAADQTELVCGDEYGLPYAAHTGTVTEGKFVPTPISEQSSRLLVRGLGDLINGRVSGRNIGTPGGPCPSLLGNDPLESCTFNSHCGG